ncbi:MAG: DUF5666 domain-containing protein [Terracidiphilus sp.]
MAALMKLRPLPVMLAALALATVAVAQDPGSAPPPGQNSSQNPGQGNGGGNGQRGGRGGGMGGGMMGRGLMGTVTEVAADHYTIKTEMGDMYTIHFGANTRITRQPAGMRGPGGGGGGGYGRGGGGGGTPPQEIKAADIKVGDAIVATGDTDVTAKSVAAMRVVQLDPATVKQIQEMAANFGKTWLQGKVTAINGTTITLTGSLDNAPHTVVADENTTFRRRRDPITLADIQVGDTVRADGAVNNGVFTATAVSMGGGMSGPPHTGPAGPPAGAPSGPPPQ